jgi:glycosyltransferase involved in cell wall biosynthesis
LLSGLFIATYVTLWVWVRWRKHYFSTGSHGKRLCYIKTDFWHDLKAGGSVTHTREFVNAGCDLGYEISVFSSDPLVHYSLKPKVEVIEPAPSLYDLPIFISQMEFNLRFPFMVRRRLAKQAIGGIYQRNSSNNFSGVFLSFLLRAPFVLEFNTPLAWAAKNWSGGGIGTLPRLCERLNLQGAYRIAVVSDALKQQLLLGGLPEMKVIVNPNGVDPIRFSPQVDASPVRGRFPVDKSLIGFIGVFGQWHGVLTLMSCVKHVINDFSNAHFVIIGDGALKPRMVEILVRDGMDQHVTFEGLVPHDTAPAYLKACDILVSPHENMADGSVFFGSPTKIFEYMSMGKPIVASNVGQLGQLLESEVDALLVKERDEAQLGRAIVRLLRDPGLRERLGSAARAKVIASYTWAENFRRAADPLSDVGIEAGHEDTDEALLAVH